MDQIIQSLLISLVLGAFIGLQFRKNAEQGHYEEKAFAGMRTCMGISLLGYITVLLSQFNEVYLLLFGSFFLILILLSYAQAAFQNRRIGGTSEIGLAVLFIVGALVGYEEINLAIIITIILSIIVSGKHHLYSISDKFSPLELIETVKFAIIIFLILPLLPNYAIDPLGVINPYNIWLLVILISGIGFTGYMASKFIGKDRGILLSGFIGGTVSSIAVTTTMSTESKRKPKLLNIYLIAILLATLTMYVRVAIEVIIINQELFWKLIIPIGAMLITMSGFALYFYFYGKKPTKTPKLKQRMSLESPLALKSAIKFALFFIFILYFIKIAELYLGNEGIYLSAIISSFADVDAISISLSQLSANQEITNILAIRAITYAVIANTFIKILYIHLFGTKILTKKMLGVFLVTSIVGILTSFTL